METTTKKTKSRKFSLLTKAKQRRGRAIERLEEQLKAKKKREKIKEPSQEGDRWVNLSEHDIKRINKELTILKSRI